jgi:hypothetical protein
MAACNNTSLISSFETPLFSAPRMCSFSSGALPSAVSQARALGPGY